jgi:hypothetical protein
MAWGRGAVGKRGSVRSHAYGEQIAIRKLFLSGKRVGIDARAIIPLNVAAGGYQQKNHSTLTREIKWAGNSRYISKRPDRPSSAPSASKVSKNGAAGSRTTNYDE